MFSLIITIIAIALVAALALATIYYGGTAFNKGAASANASKLLTQSQQILAADRLYRVDHDGQMPPSMQALVDGNYLKTIPSAMAEQFSAVAANAIEWQMVITPAGRAYSISSSTVDADSCKAVNQMSFGSDGILNKVFTSFKTQCYGPDTSSLTVLAVADPAVLGADGSTNTDLPNTPIIVGGANPGTSDWTITPGTSSGGGSSGGGTSGGGSSGGGSGGTTNDLNPADYPQAVAPAALNFGSVQVSKTSGKQAVLYTNTTSEPVSLSFSSSDSAFRVVGGTCGYEVAVGASCTYSVYFTPSQEGAATSTLAIGIYGANTGDDYSVSQTASGTGTAAPSSGFIVLNIFKPWYTNTEQYPAYSEWGGMFGEPGLVQYAGYSSTCPAGASVDLFDWSNDNLSSAINIGPIANTNVNYYVAGANAPGVVEKTLCYTATSAQASGISTAPGMIVSRQLDTNFVINQVNPGATAYDYDYGASGASYTVLSVGPSSRLVAIGITYVTVGGWDNAVETNGFFIRDVSSTIQRIPYKGKLHNGTITSFPGGNGDSTLPIGCTTIVNTGAALHGDMCPTPPLS